MTTENWDGAPVPMERWGKDHWSTFGYVETRCVDHDGMLAGNGSIDPHLRGHDGPSAGWDYPTRLPDGELVGHDDIDCIVDAMIAGLIAPPLSPDGGRASAIVDLCLATGNAGFLRHAVEEMASGTYGDDDDDDVEYTPAGRTVRSAFVLTPKGLGVAAKLRRHKAGGGSWATFNVDVPVGQQGIVGSVSLLLLS